MIQNVQAKEKYLRCQITGNKQAKLECSKMAEYLTTMTTKTAWP